MDKLTPTTNISVFTKDRMRTLLLVLFGLIWLAGCNYPGFKPDDSLQQTQIALGIQATMLSQQQTEQGQVVQQEPVQEATAPPTPTPIPSNTPDFAATQANQETQVAQAAQATVSAQLLTQQAAQLLTQGAVQPTATNAPLPTSTNRKSVV